MLDRIRNNKAFPLIALALVALVFLAAADYYGWGTREYRTPPAGIQGPVMAESKPVRLRIPKLFIDTNFVPLGLDENNEIEVPEGYTEVGWYTYGPTPGELGPSVVLGHVDSKNGPGVFLFLGQLKEGDLIHVDREDGSTATFRVTTMERYDRSNFPTQTVYGNINHAGIRLITCTGTYSASIDEYDRVLIVYGELVEDGE